MLKILVTGGGGFIGSHLVESLIDDGYIVTVFDEASNRHNISNVNWVCGDVTDLDQVASACDGQDGIVHLAAISRSGIGGKQPYACTKVNVMGTANVLEAAKERQTKPWVILGSTVDSLGESLSKFDDVISSRSTTNLYGSTKFMAELLCRHYSCNYGLRVAVLKFGLVYGSERDHQDKVLNIFISNALSGKKLDVFNPEEEHSYVHWTDIVYGIKQGVKHINGIKEPSCCEFALYSKNITTLSELAELVQEEVCPDYQINKTSTVSSGLTGHIKEKLETANKTIGYSPKIQIREGIRKTVKLRHPHSSRF